MAAPIRPAPARERAPKLPCWVVLLLAGIWGLAYVRLFIDPTPRVPLLFNVTPSLPYTVALVRPGQVYVQGSSADSFDSRYRASGLVHEEQIVARVLPVF